MRVFHDVQNALFIVTATETVADIGKTIFVKSPGKQDAGDQGDNDRNVLRPDLQSDPENRCGKPADQPTDQRQVNTSKG